MWSALKFLGIVAIGMTITVVVGGRSPQWLADRLAGDFESLAPTEKQRRLIQFSELGQPGIEPLVRALVDSNPDVARSAYDLLRQAQNDWTVLPVPQRRQRHLALVQSIHEIAVPLPDDRTGWASALLQQSLSESVAQNDDVSRRLYQSANEALGQLSLSQRAGPSVLESGPLRPLVPQRMEVVAQPLPVANSDAGLGWTDWPPADQPGPVPQAESGDTPGTSSSGAPTVYRSSANRLKTLTPGEAVVLNPVPTPRETSFQADDILPVTNLVDSPTETLEDRSVIDWLGSPHQVRREQAKLELIRRGYDGDQIQLASRIANGDVKTRIELIDAIARADRIDPRPWLLLLLDDSNRDVQMRAISVLATMKDPAVAQELKIRLVEQNDPIVAARLRRVLNLR
ncbi:MAG: HEAT repeat domain-containing protein [Pirellulales bacterium]|nr:HEAT repeat domain-containing protein [Pirellulales bacterium]